MAPRERKPALAALAVLLILVGALGATVLVMRAGNKVAVVAITGRIAAGEPIPESAIRQVELSNSTDLAFIRWSQRGDLVSNWRAATNLMPGVVLTQPMITQANDLLANGKSLVGLSLQDGQFPQQLDAGDTVAAYRVGNDAAKAQSGTGTGTSTGSGSGFGSDSTLISGNLIVQKKSSPSSGLGSGNTQFTVLADSADAGRLTIAASANQVALVLVRSKH